MSYFYILYFCQINEQLATASWSKAPFISFEVGNPKKNPGKSSTRF